MPEEKEEVMSVDGTPVTPAVAGNDQSTGLNEFYGQVLDAAVSAYGQQEAMRHSESHKSRMGILAEQAKVYNQAVEQEQTSGVYPGQNAHTKPNSSAGGKRW
jgi:hypothetical protein